MMNGVTLGRIFVIFVKKIIVMRIFILLFFVSTQVIAQLSVEKIWKNYEFVGAYVEGFNGMQDGESYSKIERTSDGIYIKKYSITNPKLAGKVILQIDNLSSNGQTINVEDYEFNSDESKLLLITDMQSIYRHSFTANYFSYDLKTNKLEELAPNLSPQTLAQYSPDGLKVSFIHNNNLYVKDLKSGNISQLTDDGKRNAIINGTTDWVYEEEFSFIKAYDWSPDNKWIAYLKFDETEVPEFTMSYYQDLYPDQYTYKYPKAGEVNSKVTLQMCDLSTEKSSTIDLGEYEYIPRLKWAKDENRLIVLTLNRHQNVLKYHSVNTDASSEVFHQEQDKAYVEIDNNLTILSKSRGIIRTSEKDGYNHLYLIDYRGNEQQITRGNFDVIQFYGVDYKETTLFYSAAENGAMNAEIYKIMVNGKAKQLLSPNGGYSEAEFTQGMNYFVLTHSDANTPPSYSLCNRDGKVISVLEDNATLKKKLSSYKLSTKEFIQFELEGRTLNAWIMKPHDFDQDKKYPVYINIYGGPGSNTVENQWGGINYMYHQLLTQKGFIVVSVDPRGTMRRGAEFKKSTYMNLGKLETEDFIDVAKKIQSYSYVDPKRIGIQGWSYGGFMTSLCMTKGADVFKMGIAVAPVTNWRYYDNIYTERFMRTPAENEDGYDKNSPINYVNQLKGKYLLIHGSADDNVHYQNTMEMINALVKADKQFDLFIYPNKNHGIYGGNTRNHLYNMMLNYTMENL